MGRIASNRSAMGASGWLELLEKMRKPERRGLDAAMAGAAIHHEARRAFLEARTAARVACELRIEAARAEVFAAGNGVIGGNMTALEREWRALAKPDHDWGIMDLWARIAPKAWIDRKLWRDSAPESRVDAAIALAADPEGVDAATRAARALGIAAAGPYGPLVRFRLGAEDAHHASALFALPLSAALAQVPRGVVERAREVERVVLDAATERFPDRPLLATDVGHAAFVEIVVARAYLPDPVAPLRALWSTGYGIAEIDERGVTLDVPPL